MQVQEQIEKLSRGATEIINLDNLKEKLSSSVKKKRPLRVKAGFDPTAPDIHLGHVVLLKKLRQFQDLGHQIFFLIGDFTAQVGDPSGRDQLRPKMDVKEIQQNAKTYKDQVFKVLDEKKTHIVFNSAWLSDLSSQQIVELTAFSTVAQMLARADFKKRYEDGKEISILEFIYPLLQGYDSVYLKADIELGGSDQKFNLLMGRQLQEAFEQSPQVVMMMPLLEGTDGVKKMSKSIDNYIGINESPEDIFGKVMSISDDLMIRYYELLTEADLDEVKKAHPRDAKLELASTIVEEFHGVAKAKEAQEGFISTFSQGNVPKDMQEYDLGGSEKDIFEVLTETKLVSSKNEIRRLLKQGAISHEGEKIQDEAWKAKSGVLKVGKRRFLRIL